MKIRTGFVSNSSSSSFCILGIITENGDDWAYDFAQDTELCVEPFVSEWDDRVAIGFYPEKMSDDETLLEFKQKILSELQKKDPEKYTDISQLEWITDGGYDG